MRRIISFLLIFAALAANARQISPEEALSIAAEFFNSGSSKTLNKAPRKAISADAEASADYQPYYIFNASDNAGFVIISGDTRAKKILGYSDRGSFDLNNMPPQLTAMLEQYANAMNAIPTSQSEDDSWSRNAMQSSNEGILLETANWGQGYPYNAQCPIIDGVQAPTGCVATAMAIVMKYHNWPETYNWGAMPLSDPEADNANEIAQLMSEIGKNVKLMYDAKETLGYTGLISHSLYANYDYSYSAQTIALGPGHISKEDWIELIINDLEDGMPIIYSGEGSSGHTFVLDGYNYNGLFHINWGWDGRYNGYFDLSVLMPYEGADFSQGQGMIFQIKPHQQDEIEYSKTSYIDYGYLVGLNCYHGLGINPEVKKIQQNEEFHMSFATLNVLPQTWFGVALMDEDGAFKELLYEELCNYTDAQDGTGFIHYLGECLATVTKPINQGDYLQIVARSNINEDWLPVRGTLETPSKVNVNEICPKVSKINWSIPDGISVVSHYCNKDFNNAPSSLAKGTLLDIYAYSDLPGLVEIDIDGFNNYRDISPWEVNKTGAVASAYCLDDEYNVEIRFTPLQDLLSVEMDDLKPGELANKIADVYDLRKISNMKLEGGMNEKDFEFIRNYIPNLKYLDISNIEIVSIENSSVNILPLNALSGIQIQTVLLPNRLEVISNQSLSNLYSMYDIHIPASVSKIEGGAFEGNMNMKRICFDGKVPCTGQENSLPSDVFIVVPSGSKSSYSESIICKNINRILEGDLIPATSIEIDSEEDNIIDAFFSLNNYHKVKLIPENSTDYIVPITQDKKVIEGYTEVRQDGLYVSFVGRSLVKCKTELEIRASSGVSLTVPCNVIEPVKTFQLSTEKVSLKLGDVVKIPYAIDPPEYSLTVYSQNPDIAYAQVGGEIEILGVNCGKATIEVCTNGVSISNESMTRFIEINVLNIVLNKTDVTLNEGHTVQLTATVSPELADNKTLQWSSSNEAVATVDQSGLVSAISQGSAVITVSSTDGSDVSASCNITVLKTSGIADMIIDADEDVKIFNTSGLLLFEGKYSDANLTKGIYIIATKTGRYKHIIR